MYNRTNWIKIDANHPLPEKEQILGYNKDWVDDDTNPNGVRLGFFSADGNKQLPTHYIPTNPPVERVYVNAKTLCDRLSHYDELGNPVYMKKVAYETDKEAIEAARKMNTNPRQIHKAVAYKCPLCFKWHVGRNHTVLTDKDKAKYKRKKI